MTEERRMFRPAEQESSVHALQGDAGGARAGDQGYGNQHQTSEGSRLAALLDHVFQQERINFLVTNRIPRRSLTRFMGWFATIEQPLVRDLSIAALQLFAGDLQLQDARKQRFSSLSDCFTRQLKDGARPIDARPHVLVSPCD